MQNLLKSLSFMVFLYSSASFGIVVDMTYGEQKKEGNIYRQSLSLNGVYDVGPEYDTPQGMCGRTNCYVGISITNPYGISGSSSTTKRVIAGPLKMKGLTKEPTFGDILRYMSIEVSPLSGTAEGAEGSNTGVMCIAIVAQPSKSSNVPAYALPTLMSCSDGSGGGVLPPPPRPQPQVSCSIDQQISLNHGVLSVDELNGNVASKMISVRCDGQATVHMSFTPAKIDLSPGKGISSSLYINDSYTNLDIAVKNSASVKISSKLKTSGNSELSGNFSGSSILNLSVL